MGRKKKKKKHTHTHTWYIIAVYTCTWSLFYKNIVNLLVFQVYRYHGCFCCTSLCPCGVTRLAYTITAVDTYTTHKPYLYEVPGITTLSCSYQESRRSSTAVAVVVFTLNRSFYPTTSSAVVPQCPSWFMLEIQIMWSDSETEKKQKSFKNQGRQIKC